MPTLDEAGVKGYETIAWGDLAGPAGTLREIILRLNAELNKALDSAAVKAGYAAMAFEPAPGPPEALSNLARSETPKWAAVIKRAGAQAD